jgi:hypothetical protein
MKYDFQLLFMMIGIGLVSKKLNWKGWFAVTLLLCVWIWFNVLKG